MKVKRYYPHIDSNVNHRPFLAANASGGVGQIAQLNADRPAAYI